MENKFLTNKLVSRDAINKIFLTFYSHNSQGEIIVSMRPTNTSVFNNLRVIFA